MAKTPPLEELHLLSPIKWVEEERRRQTLTRGDQNHNSLKWFTILAEEFGEVARALEERSEYKTDRVEYQTQLEYELIQTAAVAVAWIEAIRRENGSHEDPICACGKCTEDTIKKQGGKNDKGPVC